MVDKILKWFETKVPKYFQSFIAITIVLVLPLSLPPVFGFNYASLSLRLAILFQKLAVCYGVIGGVIFPFDFLLNLITGHLSNKPKHYYIAWAICLTLFLPHIVGQLGYNSTQIGSIFETSSYTENYVVYISFESPRNHPRDVYIQPAIIHREGGMPYYSIEKIQMRDGSFIYLSSDDRFFPNIEEKVEAYDDISCYVTLTNLRYPYNILNAQ